MPFCLHVSSSSSFLSLARTIVWTLVCTHTRTRTLLTARFRWPRFVTMRFGSSVVPLHLVPFHRQPHTPLSVLSFSFSSVPFACTCAYLLSGQDGGHMPPFGEACVCVCVSNPGQRVFHHHSFHFTRAGGSRVCSWREPTKLQVQTRISKEDALSTYLQPELLTTLSHLLCLIPWFFMIPNPKQVSYRCLQPPNFSRASADAKHC